MKNITKITLSTLTLVALSACSYTTPPSESQNSALNSISPDSHPEKKGAMQSSLDNWLSQDWTPTVEKDENIQKKYMKAETKEVVPKTEPIAKKAENKTVSKTTTTETKVKSEQKKEIVEKKEVVKETQEVKYVEDPDKHFTLQEYADKAGAYMKAHENDPKKPSHVEKINSLPAIGN